MRMTDKLMRFKVFFRCSLLHGSTFPLFNLCCKRSSIWSPKALQMETQRVLWAKQMAEEMFTKHVQACKRTRHTMHPMWVPKCKAKQVFYFVWSLQPMMAPGCPWTGSQAQNMLRWNVLDGFARIFRAADDWVSIGLIELWLILCARSGCILDIPWTTYVHSWRFFDACLMVFRYVLNLFWDIAWTLCLCFMISFVYICMHISWT